MRVLEGETEGQASDGVLGGVHMLVVKETVRGILSSGNRSSREEAVH